VVVVDDAMSAGSAMRGAYEAVRQLGIDPVTVGALAVLGSIGEEHFASHRVPVEAVVRHPFELWSPAECPLCTSGTKPEDPRNHAPGPP
jgi:orotate phosphoribosyltransferase